MTVEDLILYAEAIAEAESILDDAEDQIDTELEIWGSVKFEIELNKDQLLKHLEDCWNTEIQWIKKDSITQLKLNPDKLKDVFQSMAIVGQLDRPLCDWSSRLYEEILVPLTKSDTVIRIEENLELIEGEKPITTGEAARRFHPVAGYMYKRLASISSVALHIHRFLSGYG